METDAGSVSVHARIKDLCRLLVPAACDTSAPSEGSPRLSPCPLSAPAHAPSPPCDACQPALRRVLPALTKPLPAW